MSQSDDTQEGEMNRMQEALRAKDRELAEARQELNRRDQAQPELQPAKTDSGKETARDHSDARREAAKEKQEVAREMKDFAKTQQKDSGLGLGPRMTSNQRRDETIQRHSSHMAALPMGVQANNGPPRLQPVVMQFYCYVKGKLKVISINCLHDDEPVTK